MFAWLERLFAFTRGLPEYAQFFFYLALIFGGLTLCGIALKIWERRHIGSSLLDPRRRPMYRTRKPTRQEAQELDDWKDYWNLRGGVCDEPLHDHHDGCPSCYYESKPETKWDYRFCRDWECRTCDAPCNHPLEPDASEIAFTEAYWGIGAGI